MLASIIMPIASFQVTMSRTELFPPARRRETIFVVVAAVIVVVANDRRVRFGMTIIDHFGIVVFIERHEFDFHRLVHQTGIGRWRWRFA